MPPIHREQKKAPGVPGLPSLTVANEPLVGEHERVVDKLNGRHFVRVDHDLERFNTLNYRGGSRRIGGRGRPYSEPNRDQSRGKNRNMRCPSDEEDYAGLSFRPM